MKELDVYYQAQKEYCTREKVPMFASSSCNHMERWIHDDRYGKLQSLGEIMVEKYGDNALLKASSTHIISCPTCNKSWCD